MGSLLNTKLGRDSETTDSKKLENNLLPQKPEVKKAKSVKKIKVLIAEDEKPLAKALDLKLQREEMETLVVGNGEDAERELKLGKYDVAILDLVMPLMDGFDVLQKIQGRNIKTKIIVVSNLSQDEDKIKVKELGAEEFFVKSDTQLSTIVDFIKKTYAK